MSAATVTKRFVKSDEIETQSIALAAHIAAYLKSNGAFQIDPDTGKVIVVDGQVQLTSKILFTALWRGGCHYGLSVQGALAAAGIKVDHIAVRTSSYTGIGEQSATVNVHGLSYVTERLAEGDFLVIVDDVFDGGLTAKTVVDEVKSSVGFDCADRIKVAVGFWKPANNKVHPFVPDFVANEVDHNVWLVFPHEYDDLTDEELRQMIGDGKAKALIAIRTAMLS